MNNLVVLVQKVGKNSIDELGSPDKFLQDNAYLFGESAAFTGEAGWRARLLGQGAAGGQERAAGIREQAAFGSPGCGPERG